VFTRANAAIRTRDIAEAEKQLAARGIEIFETRMVDRGAYRATFGYKKTLEELDPKDVSNLDKAKENSRAFAKEMINRLKALQERQDGREARSV
jgi:chromosome partitioning protein